MAESSPGPESLEVAGLLARRAAGDLKVARKIAPDPEIDEAAIGFHCQQAVEKALKVGLTLRAIDFPKTHDIEFLLKLTEKHAVDVPEEVRAGGWLTPWAAEFRYDDEPLESLAKDQAVNVAAAAVAWCEALLAEARRDEENEPVPGG
jgi:HEPN domain-containing protein